MTTASNPAPPRKLSVLWLLLVGAVLLGVYATMFIPAIDGQPQNPTNGPSSLLWHGGFFYLLWMRRERKGWQGALIGAGFGVLAFALAAFIGGMNRVA